MVVDLRPYQRQAIDAVLDYWASGGGNPLVEMATGTGKSMVIATITREVLTAYPDMRVLMLVHVQELVEQNFRALLKAWPDAPAGIYSAGLGLRDAHHRITFASIQSVFKRPAALGVRDLVLIDEAHLVPQKGGGMYRELLLRLGDFCPSMRVAGFTATPYRLDVGRLDAGDGRLFTDTVFQYGISSGIRDGYLSPLISRASATEIDVSSVARRGGEFVAGALEAAADVDDLTQSAVREIAAFGQDRRSWLVFCTGVKHAFNVRDAMRNLGYSCETVTGETDQGDRSRIIRDFRAGKIRCLTNAQVLTTGFDAPSVDLVAMLRPTLSTGLYVQIVGRGTRLADGKADCLILDFAGNVRRHGPVDTIEVRPKSERKKDEDGDDGKVAVDSVKAKECPSCGHLVGLRCVECPDCGHVFPPTDKPKHEASADTVAILSTEKVKPADLPVLTWRATRHLKHGAPDSMRVSYFAGMREYPEWWAFEHGGYAGDKAATLWRKHGGADPVPRTVTDALARIDELSQPATIRVRQNGKFWDIIGRTFHAREAAQ